jgi:hypothetical protein
MQPITRESSTSRALDSLFPYSEHSCPVIYALVRNILTLPHITEFLKNTRRARAGKNVNIWMPKTKPTGHLASFETVEDALRGFL